MEEKEKTLENNISKLSEDLQNMPMYNEFYVDVQVSSINNFDNDILKIILSVEVDIFDKCKNWQFQWKFNESN